MRLSVAQPNNKRFVLGLVASNALTLRRETLLQRWLPNLRNLRVLALTEPYWFISQYDSISQSVDNESHGNLPHI
jgi:hypothetical protein